MFKKIRNFFRAYKQLGLVIAIILAAAVLDLAQQDRWAHLILASAAILNLLPIIKSMYQDLREGSYGVDILATTAIVGSVMLQEYWAGIIIVLMLVGGQALEEYAEKRAQNSLHTLLKNKPRFTNVIRGKQQIRIKVSQVVVGDKLIIAPGEVIPVDGVITEGSTSLDESALTGESLPVPHETGAHVMSGATNIEGKITIQATHTAKDSQYEQIIKLMKSSAVNQTPFVRLADRYSIPFTITAYIIAGTVWFISGDPVRALEVLVVATPCPLLLGAPIALISGMSRAAKHGIIVKTGSTMEQLASINAIAFDKTGTLTTGTPVVEKVKTFNNFSSDETLLYAAALEHNTHHVLARAIVDAAEKLSGKIPLAKHVQETSGQGISGRLQGKTIHIGRASFLSSNGVAMPAQATKEQATTATYVAVNNQLAGIITFTDTVRPEAHELISYIKKLRIKNILMVTGDNEKTAQTVAKQVGIKQVIANCLPGDKIRAIESVKDHPVAFVGDGVNDAPVLTAADVGIAMGARGSTAASESANVVIMTDNIMKVGSSIAIAKRTMYIGKQSILLGIFISIGLMGVFATGRFTAVQGALAQEVVDIAVILNALRAYKSNGKLKRS